MRILIVLLALVLFWQHDCFAQANTTQPASGIIIKLRSAQFDSRAVQDLQALLPDEIAAAEPFGLRAGIKRTDRVERSAPEWQALLRYGIVYLREGADVEVILDSLRAAPGIENASPNRVHSLEPLRRIGKLDGEREDSLFTSQWALQRCGFTKAWEKATGKSVIIGVVDTGIDFQHPDLVNRLWINSAEDINGNGSFEPWSYDQEIDGVYGDLNGIDEDGNGYPDDVIGYDFVDQQILNFGDSRSYDAIPADEQGHGTAVSGVIAAERANGIGISGAAPDARIMTIRSFDGTGNAEDDDIAAGIVYGALAGADILNLSFGDSYLPPILRDAVNFAEARGCLLVASAGNSGGTSPHYPSNFQPVMTVGATTPNDGLAIFSVSGSLLDIVAPGVGIASTEPGAGYTHISGTSFAAPLVTSAAALVLELQPDATPAALRGILQASAHDLGARGWDTEFGAGLLDAASAVNTVGASQIQVDFPINDDAFRADKAAGIPIIGSVATPLFSAYELFIGAGREPRQWSPLAGSTSRQVLGDTLGYFNTLGLGQGEYTLRLLVHRSNGATLERRVRISLVESAPQIEYVQQIPAWFNDRRRLVVTGRSDRKTCFRLLYRPQFSGEPFHELSETNRYTFVHHLVVPDNLEAGRSFEARALFIAPEGDTSSLAFVFIPPQESMPRNGFRSKPYSLPPSFLLNQTADFYGDGSTAVVVNDLSTGDFGPIKIYTFAQGKFSLRDSLPEIWIPRGIGDSNGDEQLEIFAQAAGNSVLFQAETAGSSPLATRLFARIGGGEFWAAGMQDIDGDGRDELLARSDTSFMLLDYHNGSYNLVGQAINPSPAELGGRNLFGPPELAVADFDGDGKLEICFGDEDADLMIYELDDNGSPTLEKVYVNNGSNGSAFVRALDVDGDGQMEILYGYHSLLEQNSQREYEPPLWTFRLLKGVQADSLELVWQERIYGVRPGNPFRSGSAGGNVDMQTGDEVVISAFPNTYVFRWNPFAATMQPLWYFPISLSNTALIADFDANGIAELAFGTNVQVEFFEYDSTATRRPATPLNFRAWSTGQSEALLQWEPVNEAEKYLVFYSERGEDPEFELEFFAETGATVFTARDLKPATRYLFGVLALNETMEPAQSSISPILEVFTHEPVRPAEVLVRSNRVLEVLYSGPLANTWLQPANFRINDTTIPLSVISSGERRLLLTLPAPLPEGEHNLAAESFPDVYRSPTVAASLRFRVGPSEHVPDLYLTRLEVVNSRELRLSFSEDIRTGAEVEQNYELRPFGGIREVQIHSDNSGQVRVLLDESAAIGPLGREYTITVRNVVAASGAPMTKGPGNTLGFTFAAENLDDIFVYPNPVRLSAKESVYFANLSPEAEVRVTTLSGETVALLRENDGNGGVEWNCRDLRGNLLESGIYLFSATGRSVEGHTLESPIRKMAVIR